MNYQHSVLCVAVWVAAMFAQETHASTYVIDLSRKVFSYDEPLALGEQAEIVLQGIGTAQPAGLLVYLSDRQKAPMAVATNFAAYGTNGTAAAGILSLTTTNLLGAFVGRSPLIELTFDLTVWDSVQNVVLGAAPVYLRNNPLAEQVVLGWTNIPASVVSEMQTAISGINATATNAEHVAYDALALISLAITGNVDVVARSNAAAAQVVANTVQSNLTALSNTAVSVFANPYALGTNSYKGQTHFHSTVSDGVATRQTMANAYKAAGFDFIFHTEHDTFSTFEITNILCLAGLEESGSAGYYSSQINSATHTVSLGATKAILGVRLAPNMISEILKQQALPIVAHPTLTNYVWSADLVKAAAGYVGFEVYNYFAGVEAVTNSYAEALWETALTAGIRSWAVACDDAHSTNHVGYGWIVIQANVLDSSNVMAAIRRGSFYATQGPDMRHSVTSNTIHVSTSTNSTIRFYGLGGAVLLSATNVTIASYEVGGGEGYVRAKITRDSDGKMAWGQPFFMKEEVHTPFRNAIATSYLYASNVTVEGTLKMSGAVVDGDLIAPKFYSANMSLAVGLGALDGSVNSGTNFTLGAYAGGYLSNSIFNSLIGYSAGWGVKNASHNALVGHSAGVSSVNVSNSFAGGYESMSFSTSIVDCIAIGKIALTWVTNASESTAIGNGAMWGSSRPTLSTAVGKDSMYQANYVYASAAFGPYSMVFPSTATYSVAIGPWSGARATGAYRIYIDATTNNGATYSPTNDAIFIENGNVSLGRGLFTNTINNLRGRWLNNGSQVLTNELDAAALAALTNYLPLAGGAVTGIISLSTISSSGGSSAMFIGDSGFGYVAGGEHTFDIKTNSVWATALALGTNPAVSNWPSLSGDYLPLAGGAVTGDLDMGQNAITNVCTLEMKYPSEIVFTPGYIGSSIPRLAAEYNPTLGDGISVTNGSLFVLGHWIYAGAASVTSLYAEGVTLGGESRTNWPGAVVTAAKNLTCAPTVTVTRAMLDSNRSGEFRLTLTNAVVLAVATNELGINEAATWAISILGTNAVTNASSISGWGDLAWTNSTTIPNDVIFRKSAGATTVRVRK